jgi:hypothetical protein
MASTKKDQEAAYDGFLKNAIGSIPKSLPFRDLDNDIHPLFQRASFHFSDAAGTILELDDQTYQAMLPALRLASLLITEPSMLPVFDHIANGFVTGDSAGHLYVARGSLEGTPLGLSYVQQIFLSMDPDVLFIFTSDSSHKLSSKVHASTLVTDNADTSKRPYIQEPLHISLPTGESMMRYKTSCLAMISFREYFYTYFHTTHFTASAERHLTALLSFTNILLHELTHAFALFTQNGRITAQLEAEPRFSQSLPIAEYGRAYESWLWGGPMLFDVACPSMESDDAEPGLPPDLLVLAEWSQQEGRVRCEWRTNAEMTLGTERGLGLWFLKETWEKVRAEGAHGWVLREMGRDRLVVTGNGKLQVRFDGEVRLEVEWEPEMHGFERWFRDWKHEGLE